MADTDLAGLLMAAATAPSSGEVVMAATTPTTTATEPVTSADLDDGTIGWIREHTVPMGYVAAGAIAIHALWRRHKMRRRTRASREV